MNVEQAKQVLRENGYYVANLWTNDDVLSKFLCTDDEAQEILDMALQNPATMEQIWLAIDVAGEVIGLTPFIRDKNGDELAVEDSVEVDEPSNNDLHQHSFIGNIKKFKDGNVLVEDMDGDLFEVESGKVVLTKDKY